jgi:hypothetical protein
LLVLIATFFSVSLGQPLPQVCQTEADCTSWGPCQFGAVCTEGVCLYANVEDYTPCEPYDWCYSSGVCFAGECVQQVERDCSMFSGDCSEGVCNSELERCEPAFFDFGTVCDSDVGACEHPGVCSGSSMFCEYPGYFEDGTPCSNGDFCWVGETCGSGVCEGGMERDCSGAGDTCNAGACDSQLEQCVQEPLAEGTVCVSGILFGECLDAELCDGQGACVQHAKEEGVLCRQGDGTPCNPDEVCTGASTFCPIDQIDQSAYCRHRPLNCLGDDCDGHHHDDDDDHHHDETSYWWVFLIVAVVGVAMIAFLWLLSSGGREYREKRSKRRTGEKMGDTRSSGRRSGFSLNLHE